MSEKVYLTVTALTKYIRYKFDNDVHLTNVLLEGEISNFKHHSRGHFYFTLKDSNAQISATMFYSEAKKVSFIPQDGMKVLVRGSISVYEPQGIYSINVVEMEEKGLGSLYLAYEKLKKELLALGWFNPEYKKAIPLYPKAIGVITSPTGAAVRDCINTIKRRYPLAQIYVYPTLVQGEDAKYSIVNNIKLANEQKLVDTLIVGRGGGSIEDLWAFNEKIVAEAIFNSEIPIISAVGHETDTTIADFVADRRAATPTAAAELATPDLRSLKENLTINTNRIKQSFENYLKQIQTNLMHLDERLEANNPVKKLNDLYQKKLDYDRLLEVHFKQIIMNKEHCLKIAIEKLKVLNPLAIMEKGFSVVYHNDLMIKSKNDLQVGDDISITFIDGKVKAKVTEES